MAEPTIDVRAVYIIVEPMKRRRKEMKNRKVTALLLTLAMRLTGTVLTQAAAVAGTPVNPQFDGQYWYNATKTVEGDGRFSRTKVYEENREPQRSYFCLLYTSTGCELCGRETA